MQFSEEFLYAVNSYSDSVITNLPILLCYYMYSLMQFGVLYKLAFEFCSSKIRVFKEINGVAW